MINVHNCCSIPCYANTLLCQLLNGLRGAQTVDVVLRLPKSSFNTASVCCPSVGDADRTTPGVEDSLMGTPSTLSGPIAQIENGRTYNGGCMGGWSVAGHRQDNAHGRFLSDCLWPPSFPLLEPR